VAEAQLSWLRAQPGGRLLAGVRAMAQDHPDPEWLAGDRVAAAVAAVGRAEMVCDLLITPRELTAAAALVARSPEVVFVIDHAAKPPIASGHLEPWAAGLRALAELPNTVCKISGLVTEASWDSWTVAEIAPYVDVAAQAFGPDRLLFGSDWPVCLLAAAYEDVIGLARETLAGQPADAVFAATARRVYGLEAAE
jgi:L-fuconolactonase